MGEIQNSYASPKSVPLVRPNFHEQPQVVSIVNIPIRFFFPTFRFLKQLDSWIYKRVLMNGLLARHYLKAFKSIGKFKIQMSFCMENKWIARIHMDFFVISNNCLFEVSFSLRFPLNAFKMKWNGKHTKYQRDGDARTKNWTHITEIQSFMNGFPNKFIKNQHLLLIWLCWNEFFL